MPMEPRGSETTIRPVTIFEWVTEGGPGGVVGSGYLVTQGAEEWIWESRDPAVEDPAEPERQFARAGHPGWQRFYGEHLGANRVARRWLRCVEAPEDWWWDTVQPDPKRSR